MSPVRAWRPTVVARLARTLGLLVQKIPRIRMTARTKTTVKSATVSHAELTKPDVTGPAQPKALVFVSHDSRDADIAEAFANLLSDVSAGTLKSFRSSDKKGNTGIEFGAEWYASIISQLGDATDVVALLTARSIDRPWILYEAGVAKGRLETTVLGLALGVPLDKVSTGPFGQFQNCGDDEDSLTKLVMQLLERNPDAAPREEAVRMQVRLFIATLAKILATKPKRAAEGNAEEPGVARLFEEVKAMVRELPERIDDRVRTTTRRQAGRSARRLHPKMLDEILFRSHNSSSKDAKVAALLVVLSLAKEDAAWLYESGIEIYRAMLSGDRAAVASTYKQFAAAMEIMNRGPMLREIYRGDDEEGYMLARYVPEMVERFVEEYLAPSSIRRRIVKPDVSPSSDEQA